MDDQILRPVSEEQVLKQPSVGNKAAYLLFYRRLDSIKQRRLT